jgi:hypothetical protein
MEERFYITTRWLIALTVVFIPLSIFILISGPWSANFGNSQWTRYFLFASWILLTLSIVAGVSNLIAPPELEQDKGVDEPTAAKEPGEDLHSEEPEGEGEVGGAVKAKPKKGINVGYAMLLTQAATFLLGIILYVVYISWMLLPQITLRTGY